LCIVISRKIDREWRSFVCGEKGYSKKGDLSEWHEKALVKFMSSTDTRSQYTQSNNPFGFTKGRLRIKNLMQDICYHHNKNYFIHLEPGKPIHLNELKEAIINIMGYHDVHGRALKDRMKELLKYKYISDKGPSANLFVVLNTGSDEEEFERMEKTKELSRSPPPSLANQQHKEFDDIIKRYVK